MALPVCENVFYTKYLKKQNIYIYIYIYIIMINGSKISIHRFIATALFRIVKE